MGSPNHLPNIETRRLLLSEFVLDDAPAVFAYAKNPNLAKTVTWDAHATPEDSKAFIESIARRVAQASSDETGETRFFAWAIRLRNDTNQSAVGSISFASNSRITGQIDYALVEEYWGKGFMTEAAGRVIDWAFEKFPDLLRIQSKCLVNNLGSSRVMEKSGMRFEGINRQAIWTKGAAVNLAVYAIIRGDFNDDAS